MHRKVLAAIGVVFFALMTLALAAPASAADDTKPDQSVLGRLENRADGKKTPVAGATITVTGEGCSPCTTTTGPDGKWQIPLPAQGEYTVALDVKTLPSGVALTDPSKESITTKVVPPTVNRVVIFPLGTSTAKTTTIWDQAAQIGRAHV